MHYTSLSIRHVCLTYVPPVILDWRTDNVNRLVKERNQKVKNNPSGSHVGLLGKTVKP